MPWTYFDHDTAWLRSSSAAQSENRTVLRRCFAQYPGSVTSAAVIQVPVRLDS